MRYVDACYEDVLHDNLIDMHANSAARYLNTCGSATTEVFSPPFHLNPPPSSHTSPCFSNPSAGRAQLLHLTDPAPPVPETVLNGDSTLPQSLQIQLNV